MMLRRMWRAGVVLGAVMAIASARAENTVAADGPTAGVEQALNRFLTAFDNLDWPAFRACFSRDATMFHPAAPNVKRVDTPEQFEKAWLGVFARIKRTSGRDAPPYMNLAPQDVKVEMLSPEIGLVSFHLFEGATTSRRTLIFKRFADGWKIVHLHASNIVATTATE